MVWLITDADVIRLVFLERVHRGVGRAEAVLGGKIGYLPVGIARDVL